MKSFFGGDCRTYYKIAPPWGKNGKRREKSVMDQFNAWSKAHNLKLDGFNTKEEAEICLLSLRIAPPVEVEIIEYSNL